MKTLVSERNPFHCCTECKSVIKVFFDEIQIKIPSEIKPGENYMRVIRLVGGCHQLSWLSDSIRAQNERGISDIRAVGTRGQRGKLTPHSA